MAHASDLIADDIDAYLLAHQHKSLLRFITCGSVDDGKSTLIGADPLRVAHGLRGPPGGAGGGQQEVRTLGDDLDLALLVDGLAAEREQGITIDVAYRFFSTDKRKFIVADTPGHEQYTRNMVTGASTADLAVILIDARKGVLTQTRRHSYLVSLVGIRRVVLAVNKLDLVDYRKDVFDQIVADYRAFAEQIGLTDITAIPMSALRGDNITGPSEHTPWYEGPSLFAHLEDVEVGDVAQEQPFRLPVQWVNRPDLDFRGFAGLVTSGTVRPGDRVRVQPSGTSSTVARIVTRDGDLDQAVAGQSVTLTLADEIDASRGDLLCADDAPAQVADRFAAHLVWMAEQPLRPGHGYLLKLGTRTVAATVGPPEHRVDVNTLERSPADTLSLNEIGVCHLALDRPIAFDPYAQARDTGGFLLIDRLTGATVAAGMVDRAVEQHADVRWQALDVDRAAQAQLKGHHAAALWFTGLSGSGKSTIANLVQRRLHALGVHTALLDGDNVRHGLNRDLGFSDDDRIENVRRVAEVARLMVDAGLVVLVSFISPFRAERDLARDRVGAEQFFEVHVDTPLDVAEGRDPKGLYAKARRGELPGFTGIDSPYEPPLAPQVRLDTTRLSPEQAAQVVLAHLRDQGVLG